MLTSSASQYLHPDYLQPLPTTLDAKKSPLALLAQTCSSIGKDTAPTKSIIPPLEKKEGDRGEKPASGSDKRPASEERGESGRDSKPGFRTIPPKEIPPLVPICNSSTTGEKNSTLSTSASQSAKVSTESSTTVTSVITRPVSATGSSSNSQTSTRSASAREERDHHDSSTRNTSSTPSYSKSASVQSTPVIPTPTSTHSSSKVVSGHPSFIGAFPSHPLGYPSLPLMGHGIPVDAASAPGYPSPLAAHAGLPGLSSAAAAAAAAAAAQNSVLKGASSTSALSPYVAYARVRTPSGATTLVPVCRDPYCTNCQLTLSSAHLSSTCTAPGCAQCAHEKSLTSLCSVGGLGLPSSLPSLLPSLSSGSSLSSSASALSSFHSLYPHSALATQGLPYVCNWVAGSEYCGKRFTTSEELLQHLRSHTSSIDATSLAASYNFGLPSALSACHGPYHTGQLSPNSLRRTYPTSLSPVSGLLGPNRYHPYKSPLTSLPTAPTAAQAFPPVGAYYSPYTLYGQRLGAAAVP